MALRRTRLSIQGLRSLVVHQPTLMLFSLRYQGVDQEKAISQAITLIVRPFRCRTPQSHGHTACDANVSVALNFGGTQTWNIDPRDFQLLRLNSSSLIRGPSSSASIDEERCIGAFFKLSIGGSAPQWIIGDTFLVSVQTPKRKKSFDNT